jgi:hypothetical protein
VTMGAGLRPTAKGVDEPPDPTVRAPALDPTGGGRTEKEPEGQPEVTSPAAYPTVETESASLILPVPDERSSDWPR